MIYKRATQRLRDCGILDLVIMKRQFGATPINLSWTRQQSQCFPTAEAAVYAVLRGYRPGEVGGDVKQPVTSDTAPREERLG